MTNNTLKYDIVIWGATGFTGRLVVEYLLRKYGHDGDLSWAIAGRSESKLENVKKLIGGQAIPTIIADSQDRKSLDQMVAQSKVICSTVGPYALFGSDLVASCVANRVDYCDLTGEVQWMRKMIDEHHEEAKKNGVKIVHSCGFDSIPSDTGVLFLQQEIHRQTGKYAVRIKGRVRALKGTISGGTYASLSNIMREAQDDKDILKTLFHPYGLNPRNDMEGLDKPDIRKVVFDSDFQSWISPFVMATINTKVVRRSHSLSGWPYGREFRYDEAVLSGRGIGGKLKGIGSIFGLAVLSAGKPDGLFKKMVNKFLPKPGEGPGIEERENGFFSMIFQGKTDGGKKFRLKVKGDMDPGYGSTSKMLGECAVCLAIDRETLPKSFGVITPTVAMGSQIIERLKKNAGLTYEMVEES